MVVSHDFLITGSQYSVGTHHLVSRNYHYPPRINLQNDKLRKICEVTYLKTKEACSKNKCANTSTTLLFDVT